MSFKTFVINLPESRERRSFMEAQFNFHKELDVVFHQAFDARKKTESDLTELYDDDTKSHYLWVYHC